MFIVFIFLGHYPFTDSLYLIPIIMVLLIFTVGFGLTLGILNVFIRDIGQILTIVMQFWFWLTPIVYVINIVPQKYQFILYLNPLTPIVQGFQDVLLYEKSPNLLLLLYPLILGSLLLFIGIWLFLRAKEEMTDVL